MLQDKYPNLLTDFGDIEIAKIARLNPEQRKAYEDSLKYYRDLKNVTDTAYEEGEKDKR